MCIRDRLALLVVGAIRLARDPARRWVTVSVVAFSVIFLAPVSYTHLTLPTSDLV